MDSILDLIVETDETRENVVDLFGKKETLFLGPDEQVVPDDIEWIIQRAGRRNYDVPSAFMSSKALAGINHKVRLDLGFFFDVIFVFASAKH